MSGKQTGRADESERAALVPLAPSGDGGRDALGRFAPGNGGGKGNPNARHVADLRQALLAAVSPEAIRDVAGVLLSRALAGDVAAIRELLDRTVGKATLPIEAGEGMECAGVTFVIHRAE